MVTTLREFEALRTLSQVHLYPSILTGKPAKKIKFSVQRISNAENMFHVNASQANAILGACEEGFSLIQGPPGTGKTRTIIGIVGALLSNLGPKQIHVPTQSTTLAKKLLICAPSNAAIDEIVARLAQGIFNAVGEKFNPSLVRVGVSESISFRNKHLYLDEIIDSKFAENRSLLHQLRTVESSIAKLTQKLELESDESTLAALINYKEQQHSLQQQCKEKYNAETKRRLQVEIIKGTQIVCTTLSASAHESLLNAGPFFDTVIIDEATQAIEATSLIPLKYGCKRCILVGDPLQLPPTVLSQVAAGYGYSRSIFLRMQENYPERIYLLSTQYRMRPEISSFPSLHFYQGNLRDGPNIIARTTRPWHTDGYLSPYTIVDVKGAQETQTYGRSIRNYAEIEVIVTLYQNLMDKYTYYTFADNIGVISPYKEQVRALKLAFKQSFGPEVLNHVDINTVDGFQGQEYDIIILSCVRSKDGVGFLKDKRRMNVALTRGKILHGCCSKYLAQSTLIVVGDCNMLKQDVNWAALLSDASCRGLIRSPDSFLISSESSKILTSTSESSSVKKRKLGTKINRITKAEPMSTPEHLPVGNTASVKIAEGNTVVRKRVSALFIPSKGSNK